MCSIVSLLFGDTMIQLDFCLIVQVKLTFKVAQGSRLSLAAKQKHILEMIDILLDIEQAIDIANLQKICNGLHFRAEKLFSKL